MFMDCRNLSNLILPDNVTIIESQAFYHTDLKSIVLPKSIASIGELAFSVDSGKLDIYCKAENPPAVYYYYKKNLGGMTQ